METINLFCPKCNNHIPLPPFQEEQWLDFFGLVKQDTKLFAMKMVKDSPGWSLRDAKLVVAHFNPEYRVCHRCRRSLPEAERVECPGCHCFNFNYKGPVFDLDFCQQLEASLNFENLADERVKSYWCDGIDPFPDDMKSLSLRNLERTGEISTRAWIGNDGQGEYKIKIRLGAVALRCFKNKSNLAESIPDPGSTGWIEIWPEDMYLVVHLL